MKKFIFYCFILVIIFCGCKSSNKENAVIYIANKSYFLWFFDNEYQDVISFFPDSLINHFPKSYPISTKIYTYSHSKTDEIYWVTLTCDYVDTFNLNKKNSIIVSPNDSMLYLVNKVMWDENDGYFEKLEKMNYNFIALPYFKEEEFSTNLTECKLPLDFVIYIIESKEGIFLSKEYFSKNEYSAEKLKNGFSRGYAISNKRNIIIFWLIIW
ncbi:MAG: hypothetical protein A2W91_13005 [Bacteroidetes bacterium GWF2_38_335]|nr:MAG: hypothetical protein A2W91_13005 [Bacteroidetes bacterium GWF2_38_335]HBS85826.1 hypothetical protein [Bacteroidales bacterium]